MRFYRDGQVMSEYEERFAGLQRLYGSEAYAVLRQLHICVVGVGGVGSWAIYRA